VGGEGRLVVIGGGDARGLMWSMKRSSVWGWQFLREVIPRNYDDNICGQHPLLWLLI